MGTLDRRRAHEFLTRYELDALILAEPEAFRYATGAAVGPAGLFRRAGSQFAVIPTDEALPIGIVVADFDAHRVKSVAPGAEIRTHPAWIEMARSDPRSHDLPLERRIQDSLASLSRAAGFQRPATFDIKLGVNALKELLEALGLKKGVLGFDLDFVPANDLASIEASLSNHRIVDGSPAFERIRAVKSEQEIVYLKAGLEASEQGLGRIMSDGRIGMTQHDLVGLFREGVVSGSRSSGLMPLPLENVSLGATPKSPGAPAVAGDPLKVDVGCMVAGYTSDTCRNFVFGSPSADQTRLHQIAERAFEAGFLALRPGNTLGDVHRAASAALAAEGLPSFRRGHFGHGVGLSVFVEQWPIISFESDVVIEPGMVMSFEIPLYIDGIAHFNLEDMILITNNGPLSLNNLPRALFIIG